MKKKINMIKKTVNMAVGLLQQFLDKDAYEVTFEQVNLMHE